MSAHAQANQNVRVGVLRTTFSPRKSRKKQKYEAEKILAPKSVLLRLAHLGPNLVILWVAQRRCGNGARSLNFSFSPVLDEYGFSTPFDCQHLALVGGDLK
jgi:hypothetical protein